MVLHIRHGLIGGPPHNNYALVAAGGSYAVAGTTVTLTYATSFYQGLDTNWPNAASTGPRIAVVTTTGGNKSGFQSGKRFTSMVIPAAGTFFEDCEFSPGTGIAIGIGGNSSNAFTCSHCLFTSAGSSGQACVGRGTLEYCEITGFEDGVRPEGVGWAIRRCYLHGPAAIGSDPHNDGVQCFDGDGIIEENYIDWRDTSAVMVQSFTNSASDAPGNVIIRHNWLGGADIQVRIENECAGKGNKLYENVIEDAAFGYYDVSGAADADVYGNIDSVTGALIDD